MNRRWVVRDGVENLVLVRWSDATAMERSGALAPAAAARRASCLFGAGPAMPGDTDSLLRRIQAEMRFNLAIPSWLSVTELARLTREDFDAGRLLMVCTERRIVGRAPSPSEAPLPKPE